MTQKDPMHERIRIATPAGDFAAYLARPSAMPAPAVVVIHEVFGVNADMRQTCDELAAQGYLAICPDLFWRTEPGVDMSDRTEAERKKAMALYMAFDLDAGVTDIAATVAFARTMPECSGKVGIVGYCLGGLLSYLTTARVAADVAVAYYPGSTEKHLQQATQIASPLIVHLAQEDEYMPEDAQQQIVAALQDRPGVRIHRYPGCNHAFARHRGTRYDVAAADLANGRTAAFLAEHLKPR
jgi:carboxymethylenebutenolidase